VINSYCFGGKVCQHKCKARLDIVFSMGCAYGRVEYLDGKVFC
jgi:hypothetical protein